MSESRSDSFGVALHETARAWRLKLDQRLRPLGLSQAKWRTILIVSREAGGLTQKELAERLGVEGPTLVRLLDRLAADGWVERQDCPNDRRSKRVVLRERAKEGLRQIEEVAASLRHELLEGIPEQDLLRCIDLLERIKARAESLE
ncbi:hypothetical protein CAI21_01705 [Alkalilimnicola ehrlichii]|uniref:HTH marR-type domain-containing protein n=1 Tax=Alkalilimnicola ehrlichii TaxID=351052 RepID=A0A3E0X3E8_9GAMM|nr:MarR family transcriptional regulator [Alkalilimnicola ehrlichii]RFA31364.1 hypothetical protein CAI21_01705 [Alkalilimnicola ehrlichii]RFA39362.1 hypothetical protein CAL65_00700 [Alkalilimnicola ehrlichii]